MNASSGSRQIASSNHDEGGWGTPRSTGSLGRADNTRRGSQLAHPQQASDPAAQPNTLSIKREIVVEVYEHERWSRKADGWIPSTAPEHRPHWCTAAGEASPPPEELEPPLNFGWVSNWRVDKQPLPSSSATSAGTSTSSSSTSTALPLPLHDRQGWEYSTRAEKFGSRDRSPRGEERWSDRARRRRWIRVARYRTLLNDVTAPQELVKQAQEGLKGLVRGRRAVQDLAGSIGGSSRRDSADLRIKVFNLIDLVRQHAREVEHVLRSLEGQQAAAALGAKKLANDLTKEQRLLEDLANDVERRARTHSLQQRQQPPPPEEDVPEGSPLNSSATTPSSGRGVRAVSAGRAAFRPSFALADDGEGDDNGDTQNEYLLRQMQVHR